MRTANYKRFPIDRRAIDLFISMFNELPEKIVVPRVKTESLPDGAEICDVYYDNAAACYFATVHHCSFDQVPTGCEIPTAVGALELELIDLQVFGRGAIPFGLFDSPDLQRLKKRIDEVLYDRERHKK